MVSRLYRCRPLFDDLNWGHDIHFYRRQVGVAWMAFATTYFVAVTLFEAITNARTKTLESLEDPSERFLASGPR